MEKENKKSASGWGGKREWSGAKRKLPDGAKARAARMTDAEYEKVKTFLRELRSKNSE